MSKTAKQLERQAIAAHRNGDTWADFWHRYGAHVVAAEPYNRDAFRRLRDRLLHLLTTGDDSGMKPAGDTMPWVVDDARPSDTATHARLQVVFPSITSSSAAPTNGDNPKHVAGVFRSVSD